MDLPPQLKAIGHYIKIANEHATRDPAVYYWCLFYAIQHGMEIDRTSPDSKKYLGGLLSTLEQVKKQLHNNEAVTDEMVGQAHLEEVALNIFVYADKADRAYQHDKNTVKAFYTAGHLMDVLAVFGEINEKLQEHRKYAKWKAAYIHSCLKNGQSPVPGPPGGVKDDDEGDVASGGGGAPLGFEQHPSSSSSTGQHPFGVNPTAFDAPPVVVTPAAGGGGASLAPAAAEEAVKPTECGLSSKEIATTQKLCKYAISALEYEDTATAVDNLRQALDILTHAK